MSFRKKAVKAAQIIPHTMNSTNKNTSATNETIVIVNCILNAPSILISIIGNVLVLAAILRTSSSRGSTSMIMLCNLAVSDLLVGVVVQPLYIADELTNDFYFFVIPSLGNDRILCMGSFARYIDSPKFGSSYGSLL